MYHASLTSDQVKTLEKHFYRSPRRDSRNKRSALPDHIPELQECLIHLFGHLSEITNVTPASIFEIEAFQFNVFCLVVTFKTFNPENGLLTTIVVHAGYS